MARILLVDDEKLSRAVYGDCLAEAAHEVEAVGSAPEALAALAGKPFDLVVTDLLLPGMDGMGLLAHVKESWPRVEVVVITALDKVDPAVRAIKSGAAEYLVKPVSPESLSHAVSRALTTRRLLDENASLKQHVQLMEMGQRLATTLDPAALHQAATASFRQLLEATSVLLYTRQPSGMQWVRSGGDTPPAELAAELLARLPAQARGPVRLGDLPDGRHALAFPAFEGNTTWGYAVTLAPAPIPEAAVGKGAYLAGQLGLALKNLGRFAEVEDLAYLDDLTHLFNRRYLELALDQEGRTAASTRVPFSLLFLDLDHFKSVNDTHGHLAGSKVLVEMAALLKRCVRDEDVVARYGGDEYVVLLRNADSGGALKVGERVRRTVETHKFLAREGLRLHLTTCIGVASFPEHATDTVGLLDLADRAMYRGKKGERNLIYVASRDFEASPPERREALR
ncbi:MAG: diguanylate cyclase [Deltaproteobacteria bacterium]|nr:diguanylate cyclase [Deltaproteobacteria bacterium]